MEATATREAVTSATTGVTVVGSDAPSEFHIAPRSENPTPTSAPPPPATQPPAPAPPPALPLKKKRGRPRKYGPDGTVTMALSPKPISSAAPSPPVIDFSAEKPRKVKPASSFSKSKYEVENIGKFLRKEKKLIFMNTLVCLCARCGVKVSIFKGFYWALWFSFAYVNWDLCAVMLLGRSGTSD